MIECAGVDVGWRSGSQGVHALEYIGDPVPFQRCSICTGPRGEGPLLGPFLGLGAEHCLSFLGLGQCPGQVRALGLCLTGLSLGPG